jgi:hypothetical protein
MPPAGFELAIPANKRPHTHTLNRAGTGIAGLLFGTKLFRDSLVMLNIQLSFRSTQITDRRYYEYGPVLSRNVFFFHIFPYLIKNACVICWIEWETDFRILTQATEYVNYLTTISLRCRLCSVEWPMSGTMTSCTCHGHGGSRRYS